MQKVEMGRTQAPLTLWNADKLAYIAVLAGAASFLGEGLFGLSRQAAPESWVWFSIAVPMLCLAAYTVISGIMLRREIGGLGDFGDNEDHRGQ